MNAELVVMDITNKDEVRSTVMQAMPDVIIHCAAWTAVDTAEEVDNMRIVKMINVDGTRNIAEIAAETGAKMIYVSTDYVFDGSGDEPHDADDTDCHPLNFYGQTKLGGELAVKAFLENYFIVRTSWVYGSGGGNFVKSIVKAARQTGRLKAVSDMVGTPTYTVDLARLLVDMAESDRYGHYNATNEGGFISWYEFAKEICSQADLNVEVVPVSAKEYDTRAANRPLNSRLDKSKLTREGFVPLPNWKDALERFFEVADLEIFE